MKRTFPTTGRFALTSVAAAAALWFMVPDAQALGLGRLTVQSALGEALRAEIDVTSISADEAASLSVAVAKAEAYRAAGVDYNSVLPSTQVALLRRADGRSYLRLTSDRGVQEPFVDVILELNWSSGRLVREYTALFDPPSARTPSVAAVPPPAPAPATSPIMSPAPAPSYAAAPPSVAPPPRERRQVAPPPVPLAPRPMAAAPSPSPSPSRVPSTTRSEDAGVGGNGGSYRVRSGDTLSGIAGKTQKQGVSLDQMLVSLYRANPDAFMDNNMNRLKAGSVLAVPTADAAKSVSAPDARDVIHAQSADFGAYRHRLASGVPAAVEGSTRQAGGKVQAAVEDRKQTAATTPDKLTLSKGAPGSKASAAEDRASKERERRDTSSRVAELSKSVEELRRLSGSASAASGRSGAPATATTPVAPVVPAIVAQAPVAVVPPPLPVAPPPVAPPPVIAPPVIAPPAVSPPAAASAPLESTPVASTPVVSAPVVAPAASVAAPVQAPAVVPPAASAPVAHAPSDSGSFFDENPLLLALGGALVALLAGYGVYRYTRRARKDSGETSFLESRLQPDSFFGASGGQRIDTRDAGGASSSMSYSLSQLDAIGDVDPVAEADVYLAYGRDLQAEEILKEAMRSTPERLAIRTKLLEVYAKRRDTKGFELLATQLFSLTRGEGDDWAKAQELGAQIDPENALYQPGGSPAQSGGPEERMTEPLGASTMPQSVLPSPSRFEAAAQAESTRAGPSSVDLDLDLDLDTPPPRSTFDATASTRPAPFISEVPFQATELPHQTASRELDLPSLPEVSHADSRHSQLDMPMDFDLSEITLDLDKPHVTAAAGPDSRSGALDSRPGELESIDFSGSDDDGSDPLSRKLELAEEFRQIGDVEGARDLLQEVLAKAEGGLRAKAQGMLDDLD